MYLQFQNVILITICLTFSTEYVSSHTVPERELIELIVNKTTNAVLQNKTNCLSKDNKLMVSNVKLKQVELQTNDDETSAFLTKGTDSIISSLLFSNKEQSIDILKEATNSVASRYKIPQNKKESVIKNTPVNETNVTNSSSNENKSEENYASIHNSFSKNAELPSLSINEETDDIINASDALVDSKNTTINSKVKNDNDKQETSVKYVKNFTAPLNTTENSNNNFEITAKIPTSMESQMVIGDIALSELTNLANDDGEELNVGQKILIQKSNMSSDIESTNSAGAEILRNLSSICGSQFGKRISFANQTTLMEFPWTALLIYNTKIRYHCGGSLITYKYVLTAAHCVVQQFYELIGVRLGEHDISQPVDCAPDLVGELICATTVDANVIKIIVHHDYSHLSFKNDIALLRLDKDYINRSFYPICISTPDMKFDERNALVAGWGATEKALRSMVLLKAEVPIFDISKCQEIYRYSVFNDSTEICGSGATEVDVCKGDSGGALFYSKYDKGKDKYYQLGIVSLGVRRCGDSRFLPAVFTKINGFYKWIETNLEY